MVRGIWLYVCSLVLRVIHVKAGLHLALVNKFAPAMTLTVYTHTVEMQRRICCEQDKLSCSVPIHLVAQTLETVLACMLHSLVSSQVPNYWEDLISQWANSVSILAKPYSLSFSPINSPSPGLSGLG